MTGQIKILMLEDSAVDAETKQQFLEAEQELFKERNLLRTVIDNLPDYIYLKDSRFDYIIANCAL
ncbi:MAG TPA: hypothetical protein VK616_16245 [Flavitalea sp.]|nr:hypothetical protein [Flavitalea sp.]HTF30597.1 hypothetical protein [Flavitalea sp.]